MTKYTPRISNYIPSGQIHWSWKRITTRMTVVSKKGQPSISSTKDKLVYYFTLHDLILLLAASGRELTSVMMYING